MVAAGILVDQHLVRFTAALPQHRDDGTRREDEYITSKTTAHYLLSQCPRTEITTAVVIKSAHITVSESNQPAAIICSCLSSWIFYHNRPERPAQVVESSGPIRPHGSPER